MNRPEYKMSNLAPSEEQLITGYAMGSFRIDGVPTAGDVLTYTITPTVGSPLVVPYTVQASDLTPHANPTNPSEATPSYLIALGSALAITNAGRALGYVAAGVMPGDAISPGFLNPYFAEVLVTGPSSNAFALSAAHTGTTNLAVQEQAAPSAVVASLKNPVSGAAQAYYGYVAILDALAMLPSSADLSLKYTKADVVGFRPDEVRARRDLYAYYCEMLSRDMGGKEYIQHFFGGSSAGAIA